MRRSRSVAAARAVRAPERQQDIGNALKLVAPAVVGRAILLDQCPFFVA
jgi:hypothetical protein